MRAPTVLPKNLAGKPQRIGACAVPPPLSGDSRRRRDELGRNAFGRAGRRGQRGAPALPPPRATVT